MGEATAHSLAGLANGRRELSCGRAPVVPPDQLIRQPAVIAGVILFDLFSVAAIGALTHFAVFDGDPYGSSALLLALAGVAIGAAAILKMRWAYTVASLSHGLAQVANVGLALSLALGGLIVAEALFGTHLEQMRRWVPYWLAFGWAAGSAARLFTARALGRWSREGRLARRAVIVGGGDAAAELIDRLDRSGGTAIQILGLFDDRDKMRSPETVGRYRKLGRFDDLEAFCREQRVDLLIIALPPTAEERILYILKKLWVLPIDVRIAAFNSKLKLRSRAYNYIGDTPFLPVFDKPMSDSSVALKAIEDRVLAAIGIILLAPLLALIALAVKLDSRGPVFFKQTRHGFNNEPIGVLKFRSMYVDKCDVSGQKQVTRGDPRVTRVGAILRRTSLDELPQLFNVLRGELSLVGPRPHVMQAKVGEHIYDEVVDGYFARHKVKPGITGWAQVNGWRGETDTVEKIEQRVAHDLYYIENWSMLLDLRILASTPWALITTKNAY
ncbi:undecaprenyl-phosphate glucose phosphotransferase [Methylocystis sp. Sn-Cys]|uniref:undecaprenyl-phosphate glucose phosphotransferase n=1 Tax=Methylocystis sp. Sn-Cys TaxID=1701263 RepID=UPI001923D38A|nr:undecaprenyl-phosphate glucose phosphotransferase [Methylocystis sp. Sn-Cys]MBL1258315.1 undecaprenyl-phosphate glucose phosphotransferase [Methylocystis sp. Sn-Cys]